ncbi:sensor histidine kinase [Tenacibaculum amylolyticum]|uniref:sensor histidine kinase n=1 Tax=Tenacibaculum amylolyticum TaxID=104269 RepID=UPI00389332D9
MNKYQSLSNKFIAKLSISFLVIILTIGIVYIVVTFFLLDKFYSETTQRLNANVASHLIEEKFQTVSPFLDDGAVNKEFFDDLMHDMMAVNRAIEVYLLDEKGMVLHSIVLDHTNKNKPLTKVDLAPIKKFIANNNLYVLGDDPKDINCKKIFSAAPFESKGKKGFIYVLLASKSFDQVWSSLFKGYFSRLTFITLIITMILAMGIGWLSIVIISKSLLTIILYVNQFKEGNLDSRIPNANESNLSILATTFNEMADTIAANIEEIYSVNRFKKELIANVSHDLRTPLTVIRGYAETLKMNEDIITEQNKKEFLKIIEQSTLSLSNLVNHLFDYSNLDAKEIKPKRIVFNITELISTIIKRYTIITKEKGIRLISIEESPVFVYADKILIERVLQNILDNALKFTPTGGEISFKVEKKKEKTFISIKDTGPGIDEEEKKHIFKRYTTSSTPEEKMNIGLGLAIVKKIMDLHETDISIYCEGKNKGCIFEFYLPSVHNNW